MNSPEHFIEHIPWTPSEKKIARKAFDHAFEKQCASIKAETEELSYEPTGSGPVIPGMLTPIAAPEPQTIYLLGIGLPGVIGLGFRNKRLA